MNNKGLILINSYYHGEDIDYQIKRLKEEFTKYSISLDVKTCNMMITYLDEGKIVLEKFTYDFVLYLDKDKYLARMLEKAGIRVFNKASSMAICDEKMLSYISLSEAGIKMPKTLPGALCYQRTSIKKEIITEIEKKLTYPLIIKESYGSMGKQVYLINNREELLEIGARIMTKPHLFQEYIRSSHGKDFRVIVINKRVVASMLRKSKTDFRSNLSEGGFAYKTELPQAYQEMAIKTAEILDLDYCGVDILIGEDQEPIFCEINANAFFTGIEKTTGINVAGLYCDHIYQTVYLTK